MNKESNGKDLQELLLLSTEGITNLLKAVANVKRFQLLSLLVNESLDFSTLLDATDLKKTALANHLSKLLDKRLIERVERGKYQITKDGQELIESAAAAYSSSKAREFDRVKQLRNHHSRGRMKKMDEKIVTNEPAYQPCWISYLGAVAGALTSLGTKRDIIDVGGYTGYAFIVNVAEKETCPSGPTALGESNWLKILKSTNTLGWNINSVGDFESFPMSKGALSAADQKRAKKLFDRVKKSIDDNKPVVLWGLPIPEYGIAKGYKGDSYQVSTYRSLSGGPDEPVRYDALQAPGGLHAIYFQEERETPKTEDDDKRAIKQAIKFAEGKSEKKHPGYAAGPAAFEKWATVLEKGSPESIIYHGNSYVGACVHEAKALASKFLERLTEKYSGKPQAEFMDKAAKEYEKAHKLMNKFEKLFPFAMEGEMPMEKRKKGAEILRDTKNHDIAAISYLQKASINWA